MPAPASNSEFLELVRKSRIVDAARLETYTRTLTDGLPPDPGQLAGLMVRDGLLTYFQAEQLLQGKWKRFYIGKYKVLEKIGSGGMGQVFLCEHKLMRRRVALKVLPTAKAAEAASLDRFYREARAVAALDHPNIVRAYDIDDDENLHFLVMEYVDGANLQEIVKKSGPLDVARACHYAYGAAVGLQYAYEQGIVHRDIKPGNILVDRAGVVKILDMGLARFFNDDDDAITRKYDENILGTADYLSPEQAVDSHTVTIQSDIYSLGGTLYYMLTGAAPFPDGTIAQKLLWHQTKEPAALEKVRPDVPTELATIVRCMMARDLRQRYATPAALLTDLAVWVQTPIAPPPERELPQLSPAALPSANMGLTSRPAATVSGLLGSLAEPSRAGWTPSGTGLPAGHSGPALSPSTHPSMGTSSSGIPIVSTTGSSDAVTAPAGVWESLAADDGLPPRPERSGRLPQVPAAPRRRWLWPAVGLMTGLVAAGAGWLLLGHTEPAPPAAAELAVLLVDRAGVAPASSLRRYTTLTQALQNATAGATIRIYDDVLTDPPLVLSGGRYKKLTIEPAIAGHRVRWTPPAPTGGVRSLLELHDVDGLTMRQLWLDIQGRYDTGVTISGLTPGVVLDGVEISGVRTTSIRLSAAADPGRPVSLTRCYVRAPEPSAECGIHLDGTDRVATRSLRMTNCRIVGPVKEAVRVTGSATDVELSRCRIFQCTRGIVFNGPPPLAGLSMSISHNTFDRLTAAAFTFATDWKADGKYQLSVEHNLVLEAGQFVALEPGVSRNGSIMSINNGRRTSTPDGLPNCGTVAIGTELLPRDPDDDATFLRYRPGHAFATVGVTQRPVGVPPE